MATPAEQQDTGNEQQNNTNNGDKNGPPPNIPVLYVPDLLNTVLSEAIKDGMQVGNTGTQYHHPYPGIEGHPGCRMTQGDTTHRRVGDLPQPSTGFHHQVPTNTIKH